MGQTQKIGCALACAVISFVALGVRLPAQNLTYTKGQNIAPAFEGWEQDADGSKYFVFGYMNRNWAEEIDIPPGPENGFTPGGPIRDSRRISCHAAIVSSSACRSRKISPRRTN